jgi:EmrB/QacA subfamily drug resistance transporter
LRQTPSTAPSSAGSASSSAGSAPSSAGRAAPSAGRAAQSAGRAAQSAGSAAQSAGLAPHGANSASSSSSAADAASAAVQAANPQHRWAILAILGLAQLMVVLDVTVVNIALPSAQRALRFSNADRQWIITAYSLAFGTLLLVGGKLSDLVGRKSTFAGGLVGFVLASAVGGASHSFLMLAAARTFQGAFAALLAPTALALLSVTFTEPGERNKAFGIYGAIAGSGASVGLLLGGVLTQYLSWRWCLYVNLPIGVLAVAGTLRLLHDARPSERPRLDLPGVVSVSAGLFALVFGFSHAQTASWSSPVTIAMLIAGVILLALFSLIERRAAQPLLPPRVVADRNRAASFLSVGIASAAMFGVFLFLTYYLQSDRGYSPVRTGLAFLPMTAAVVISAVLGTTYLRVRFGPRALTVLGMALGAAGMGWLTRLGLHTPYATGILPPLMVMAVGIGLVFSSGMFGATLGVVDEEAGVASATVNATQQIGGALGTALLSTLAASAANSFLHSHLSGLRPSPPLLAAAAVHGYTVGFAVAAGIFVFGAFAGLLFEGRSHVQGETREPVAAMH